MRLCKLSTSVSFVILVSLTIPVVISHLDLFMPRSEVLKLLGLNAELYYVRFGLVNTYAMDFVILVPAHIAYLEFTWKSFAEEPLPYIITLDYDLQGAMLPPQVNVSNQGYIPTTLETFRVELPCTGLKSAEIEVHIRLNITSHNRLHDEIYLNFRRNKICLKGVSAIPPPRNDTIKLDTDGVISYNGTFYIAVGCAAAMISVVVLITSAIYVKSKKQRNQSSLQSSYTSGAYGSNQNVFIRLDSMGRTPSVGSGSYATIASIHKFPIESRRESRSQSRRSPSPYATTHIALADNTGHVYVKPDSYPSRVSYYASSQLMHIAQVPLHDPRLYDPSDKLRELYEKRKNITLTSLVQEGTFGQIYRGQLSRHDELEEVIIKTVTDAASKYQVNLFLAEGTMMHGLNHKNILTIIASNTNNPKQPLLIYPYINKGNLKRFLMNCRIRGEEHYTLLTQDLVDMSIQIVLAIMYLHSQHICHKDIATRNCVVDEKLRVKLTDNALSRDIWPSDYHCLGDNENRPVKWMALESLVQKQFSATSDVWSFGVLLWELTTLAQQPYSEVDPFEISAYLGDGYRLAQPVNCPDELFAVMACCWLTLPEERPTFVQLLAFLQDFYTALGRFI